jgi:carbon monoxide dehydrogenase subunit G
VNPAGTPAESGSQRVRAAGEIAVDVAREKVFAWVREAEKIARCIPGCRDLTEAGPGRYAATLTGKVGFVVLSFKVNIEVAREETPSALEARIVGDAIGKHGHLTANASLQLDAPAERQTVIRYATDVGLTGKLGGLGQPAFNAASVKLAQEFGANLKAEIESAFWAERFS